MMRVRFTPNMPRPGLVSHFSTAACQCSENTHYCEHGRRTDMKAVRLHEPVGIPGLRYEDAPDPVPAIGDVLVKVHASGITPTELDWPLWTDQLGHKRDYIVPAHEFRARSLLWLGAPRDFPLAKRSLA